MEELPRLVKAEKEASGRRHLLNVFLSTHLILTLGEFNVFFVLNRRTTLEVEAAAAS